MAPLEMNAGTCWGKNTIDPSGGGIEKPRKASLTFLTFGSLQAGLSSYNYFNPSMIL
jgi:hypothetical protein